jgi:hypothetical protein
MASSLAPRTAFGRTLPAGALLLLFALAGAPAHGGEPRGEYGPPLYDPPPHPAPPAPTAPAAEGEDDSPGALLDEVDRALAKGVAWLLARQLPNGSWGSVEGNAAYGGGSAERQYTHPAGPTALALYTLLKCGVPADHERIRRGFRWLKKEHEKPGGSYETSMLLLAVTATADADKSTRDSAAAGARTRLTGEFDSWARVLRDHLLAKRKAAKSKGWRYQVAPTGVAAGTPEKTGEEDLSSTQLAAMALFAAERAGLETPLDVWFDLVGFALRQQEATGPEHPRAVHPRPQKPAAGKPSPYAPGTTVTKDHARGFAYLLDPAAHPDEGAPTGSMTACGLGTVLIARWSIVSRSEKAWSAQPKEWRDGVQRAIHDGFAWLDLHWNAYANPQKRERNVYHIYYAYCVERAMDLVDASRLGTHSWYPEMARQLTARQHEKGFWDSNTTHAPGDVLDTCFALLVLRRATRGPPIPVVTDEPDAPARDGR